MGCFNTRCSYSGTEIVSDDEVMIFFIKNNGFGNGDLGYSCYSWDNYELFGPGIPATYNEYGWYEFDETDPVAVIMQKHITKNFIPNLERSRSIRDHKDIVEAIIAHDEDPDSKKADRPNLSWRAIGDFIHDGCLFVENPHSGFNGREEVETYIHVMAIHRDHYEDFISKPYHIGWGKDKQLIDNKMIDVWNHYNAQPKMTPELQAIIDKPRDERTVEESDMYMDYVISKSGFRGPDDDLHINWIDSKGVRIRQLAKELDVGVFVERTSGMYVMANTMNNNGVKFRPHGAGNQCYNYQEDIDFLEDILDKLKKRKEAKENELGEDL